MDDDKITVLIFGNFHSHPSGEAFLKKFLNLLFPLTKKIILVSGDMPEIFKDKIMWIKTTHKKNQNNIYTRILNIIYNQVYNQLIGTFIILNLLKKRNVDMIVFLSPIPLTMFTAKILKKKVLLYQGGSLSKKIFHNNSFIKFCFQLFFEKLPNMLSDVIIVESNNCLNFQDLKKYHNKVNIIPQYVNTNLFINKVKINDRKNIIGYNGSIEEYKGIDLFVQAIININDYLRKNNISVIIGGEGPLLNSIKNSIDFNHMSDIVSFTGWMPYEKLPDRLNELSLLVLPSYSEGLPNIILESMACGTPVLVTPVGALPDIIQDELNGFIMENNSPEQIANNIVRSLEFNDKEKVVSNALSLINNNFTYESALNRYKNILDKLH